MNLQNLVAISGRSGLFKMVGNRSNGLVVEELATGKRMFVSGRLHEFTPLESISIYVDGPSETVELSKVFENMKNKQAELPVVNANASGTEIKDYFGQVLPEYDKDRVLISDIKKIIKWFSFLAERNLLN
jgi:hypothetical protein